MEPKAKSAAKSKLLQTQATTTSTKTTTLVKFFLLIQILNQTLTLEVQGSPRPLDEDNPLLYDTNSLYKPPRQLNQLPARAKRSAGTAAPTASQFVDACQSKVEVITPYYARNSKGKLRTIVNSEQMQQAIQIESCVRSARQQANGGAGCSAQNNNCFCEQKYKWHRLLVLDSKDSQLAKGLFMDWFLFPSSCSCRCKSGNAAFQRLISARVPERSALAANTNTNKKTIT